MFSTSIALRLQARGIHYGWVAAGVTLLTMLTMFWQRRHQNCAGRLRTKSWFTSQLVLELTQNQ